MSQVLVIGAGLGGLSAAMRLAHAGLKVEVFEAAPYPGGKLRALPSPAGPVDAGPTVLTMGWVFETLFHDCGLSLADYVTLTPEPLLARHFWPDGTRLDLYSDHGASIEAVHASLGATAAREFQQFDADTAALFDAFLDPVMLAPHPSLSMLTGIVLRNPGLWRKMASGATLTRHLNRRFSEPKLAQLFGRYATYVGGLPHQVPALLSLVWQAEAGGISRVEGGMHQMALGMAQALRDLGGEIHCDSPVRRILHGPEVELADGSRRTSDHVVFNGDPKALWRGDLGADPKHAIRRSAVLPRSLSAEVWTFAASPRGADLHHHNVFFGTDPTTEFEPIGRSKAPEDPAIYVCAQDRGTGRTPPAVERFQTIVNAAPLSNREEVRPCYETTLHALAQRGLSFASQTDKAHRTTPKDFAALFPGSLGSLYGRSPKGMLATFQRPCAQSRMKGLYLAGGGTHPGAGMPMATLSGKHAAEAILSDRTSTSTSRQTATRGGI
ncbi:1-hydroxycarotenoid 3,4-desaturase CrtD [Palleronia caenipelagi]|uniref:FAD-binding protein n=1 Tax=Palleronia caenipelagi TaxID=2489174 RepID=A0A547Q7R0_9RHOB|nr:1-hydroxycarotenoid 3,4-desaturase CrtD [Palleronia caenipelagi]TRD22399.1 FAD-binding protein [Palleronia caenipelagi]